MSNKPKQAFGPAIPRISDVMAHTTRYAFFGVARLAKDARVDVSSVSRLINGKVNPSAARLARITEALECAVGCKIDPRDLIAEDGEFLTRYVCDLVGCRGCLPEEAYDRSGKLKAAFAGVAPGMWVTSRYPHGYQITTKEVHD